MGDMKALLHGHVLADSDDVIACAGYQYFPPSAVRTEWLEKTARTDSDLACPHGVQFYDAVIAGVRHARVAWIYEAPRSATLMPAAGRFGFWKEVELG
jgi:uncharacterized protein (DUF427 family)